MSPQNNVATTDLPSEHHVFQPIGGLRPTPNEDNRLQLVNYKPYSPLLLASTAPVVAMAIKKILNHIIYSANCNLQTKTTVKRSI